MISKINSIDPTLRLSFLLILLSISKYLIHLKIFQRGGKGFRFKTNIFPEDDKVWVEKILNTDIRFFWQDIALNRIINTL